MDESKMLLRKIQLRAKNNLESLLKIQIMPAYHHGHFECFDMRKSGFKFSTIFDVGANIGQSASKFEVIFPEAKIYCFEPVKSTFEALEQNTSSNTNIDCYNFALGQSPGQAEIYVMKDSRTSSLVKSNSPQITNSQPIEIRTVDSFSCKNQIEKIDLLKIDAEGFDLEVLKGSQGMLLSGKIPFVLVEVGFSTADNLHVRFDEVCSYLFPMGYSVFGIYDQKLDFFGKTHLRFANACFSHESALTT